MSTSGLAVVTGGSRGIGKATVLGLARDGFDVALSYRANREMAEEVVSEVQALGREAWAFEMELGSLDSVSAFAQSVQALERPIGGLVHNAGLTRDGLFVSMKEDAWTAVTQAHLNGFYALTRPLLRGMLKERCGRIVTIVSFVGEKGNAGQVNYAAAKAGLMQLTKTTAVIHAKDNVRVNCVVPGLMHTPMLNRMAEKYAGGDLDGFIAKRNAMVPMRRMGDAQDVANAVLFLAADESSYITATDIVVDGGITAATQGDLP